MIDWLLRDPKTTAETRPADEPILIEIGGRELPLLIRRHTRARRMTMRLSPDGGEIRITLPRWAASSEAMMFVRLRRGWLEDQVAGIPERVAAAPGTAISYCGDQLAIDWRESAPRRPSLSDDRLVLGGPQDSVHRRVHRWLESEATRLLTDDLAHYCSAANCDAPPLRLSRAQRRWGSCSGNGVIRINWRLVQAPHPVRRSVVAHEVTHLFHFDHSPQFHALLGKLFEDDVKSADRWLKAHGRSLYIQFG